MFAIKNGSSGDLARVDITGRLHVQSVSETEAQHASEVGSAYILNTGIVDLTTNASNALLYFKNNEQEDVIFSTIAYSVGINGERTESLIVSGVKNPTGGTIISEAVPMPVVQNINFGSPKNNR